MLKLPLKALRASILPLILSMRQDLRALGFDRPENWPAFKRWLLNHGINEYPALREFLLQHVDAESVLQPTEPASARSPFGVNLVGYAFGELGIGEDVRMAGRALLAAQVPMVLLNFKPGDDIPQNDQSMAGYVCDEGRYGINIFCMTAQENARNFLESGHTREAGRCAARYGGHYNIGYWPWELSVWPKDWELSFDLVDEVWVSTWHTYDCLADICPKPLFHMPMAVDLPKVKRFSSKARAREHFNLPQAATLFCFSFDLNSSIHRKNPQACVDAFLNAFPKHKYGKEEVGLVIKVHTPKQPHPVWDKLKRLVKTDPRIHVIEGTLPKPELLALYKACDCFLSLHRAEGFGRGIAEALKLGLHVITTGYSGNVDFCHSPQADLVDYTLIAVQKGQYPYSEGQVWADPDIEHAAKLMKQFVDERPNVARKLLWPEFSGDKVGQRYKKRLQQIRAENPGLFQDD